MTEEKEFNTKAGHVFSEFVTKDLTSFLINCGIAAGTKGYYYLQVASDLIHEDPSYIFNVTKRLYPAIAKRCDSTDKRVERSIRYALLTAWEMGSLIEILNASFGKGSFRPNRHSIPNREFFGLMKTWRGQQEVSNK